MNFLKAIFRRQLIGLDIGVSGVKAVELSGSSGMRLMAYNRVPLPWNTISPDGEVKNRNTLIVAIKKLFEAKGFSSRRVAVGAFGNSIMTKKISVPRMSTSELSEQLYWEAEQYIPFNINEVNLDFAILDSSGGGTSGTPNMDVLLVAAKKDYVQSLLQLVEDAGLVPEVVDCQAFALGNAFEFNYSHLVDMAPGGATSVIIDFGAGSTKISIVEGDKTVFTRDLRQCGIACTLTLSERLGIAFEEAEQAKINDAENASVRNVIGEFNTSLVEEISRTIDFSISQSADRAIQGIYICGGASKTYGLVEELEARMPAPVQFLNPVQSIVGSGRKMNAQAIRELSLVGSVAIGLAMRSTGDAK
jgi:type IV pilus assembly protein PilM